MQVIHNLTQLVTEFIQVDEEGNVIDRKRVQQDISALKLEEFEKAFAALAEWRDKWRSELVSVSGEYDDSFPYHR